MNERKKFSIPFTLILIDIAGALIVAWGFYRYVGGEGGFLYIAAGLLLMAPLALHFLRIGEKSRARLKSAVERDNAIGQAGTVAEILADGHAIVDFETPLLGKQQWQCIVQGEAARGDLVHVMAFSGDSPTVVKLS